MSKQNSCCTPAPRKEATCCEAGQVNIALACSGGSNVGQIANEVAKELDRAGDAKFFCVAGLGGHIGGMVASVKGADKVCDSDSGLSGDITGSPERSEGTGLCPRKRLSRLRGPPQRRYGAPEAGDTIRFASSASRRIPATSSHCPNRRDKVLVVDGCPVACAKKCADEAGVSDYEHLVVTELGIEKEHAFDLNEEDMDKTLLAARDKLATEIEPI